MAQGEQTKASVKRLRRGMRIKAWRRGQYETVRAMARMYSISPSQISDIESGVRGADAGVGGNYIQEWRYEERGGRDPSIT